MRFDLLFTASLLPAIALAQGAALGPAARKNMKTTTPAGVSLMSTDAKPINDGAGRAIPGNPDAVNLCGSTSFKTVAINPKDSKLPKVEDALTLATKISSGKHIWQIPTNGREIVRYKTVAFFAKAEDQRAAIGNQDIVNLLEDAAKNHAQEGFVNVKGAYQQLVSEKGVMACDDTSQTNGLQSVSVEWRIGPPSARYPGGK